MLLSGACILACSAVGAPALAKSKADDSTCHLKNYSYLVGAYITETANIGGDHRLLEVGKNPGPVQPKRLTIVYDSNDNRIVSVNCG
jgi:hypothetical protein